MAIEYRWAEGQYDRLPALAADLVRRQVSRDRHAGQHACGAGGQGGDHDHSDRVLRRRRPGALGLVASLNRPGGNITGVTSLNVELGPKRLELLHEARAHGDRDGPARQSDQSRTCRDSRPETRRRQPARSGCKLHVLHASTERDFDTVFASLAPTAGRRACDRPRRILHQPARTARRTGAPPRDARDLSSIARSPRPAA